MRKPSLDTLEVIFRLLLPTILALYFALDAQDRGGDPKEWTTSAAFAAVAVANVIWAWRRRRRRK